MGIEKILFVNDDADDIQSMVARLPAGIVAQGASQFQAGCMVDRFDYDLIVLDNDANDLKESKGAGTLECIREKSQDIPVIYTSFQPGWVPEDVFRTKGVQVVKTDEIVDFLGRMYGIEFKPLVEMPRRAAQVSILMSYNPIEGYSAGVHSNGRLLVIAREKCSGTAGREVVREELGKLYGEFDWRADRDLVKNIFVYDGINGGREPGQAAASLGHDVRMKVNLMACHCDWERKKRFANSMYVDLYAVECGGRETMGAIADVLVGISRPNIDYDQLPIPRDKILTDAQKFKI